MKKHRFRRETEAVRGGTDIGKKTDRSPRRSIRPQPSKPPTCRSRCASFPPTASTPVTAIPQYRRRKCHRRTGRRRRRPVVLFRYGRDHDFDSLAGEGGRPHRGAARYLWRSHQVPFDLAAQAGHRDDIRRHQRHRAARARHSPNTRLLHIESPTNPTLRVVDLEKIAALARKHNLITTIDSTFATPINCRPAEWGIDLVLHSGTKYFAGHSDLICGVAAGRRDLIDQILPTRTTLGCCMDPHAAFLLLRGIKTLAVRVERQNQSALRIAEFLSRHPKVARVYYPMLKGHPDYAIAKKQMAGAGAVLSLEVEGSGADACRLAEALNLFTLAPSLGSVDSLVTIPLLTSHYRIDPALLSKIGVTEQMIRCRSHRTCRRPDRRSGKRLAVLSQDRVRAGVAD